MHNSLSIGLGKLQYHCLNCHLLLKEHYYQYYWVSLSFFITYFVISHPFSWCPDLSLLCGVQLVSAPCSVTFFPSPDLFCPLLSPVCECPLLGHFLSVS